MVKITYPHLNFGNFFIWIASVLLLATAPKTFAQVISNRKIISYTVDLQKHDIGFYWEDDAADKPTI